MEESSSARRTLVMLSMVLLPAGSSAPQPAEVHSELPHWGDPVTVGVACLRPGSDRRDPVTAARERPVLAGGDREPADQLIPEPGRLDHVVGDQFAGPAPPVQGPVLLVREPLELS